MTVSFIHHGDATWASYRYRAARPAAAIGATLNDTSADVLIVSKPEPADVAMAIRACAPGRRQRLIVDYCDAHFQRSEYLALLTLADTVTCPTPEMARLIFEHQVALGRHDQPLSVIPDPYEFEEHPAHAHGLQLLWFGHPSNAASLARLWPTIQPWHRQTRIMGLKGELPWSLEGLRAELARADVVLLPATAPYKSANRALEALRSGCLVLAEPHPSLLDPIPGVLVGDIPAALHWLEGRSGQWAALRQLVTSGQAAIRNRFSLETIGAQWQAAITAVAVPR